MNAAKEEVTTLLENLPDGWVLEDIQYHLYVVEKIQSKRLLENVSERFE